MKFLAGPVGLARNVSLRTVPRSGGFQILENSNLAAPLD